MSELARETIKQQLKNHDLAIANKIMGNIPGLEIYSECYEVEVYWVWKFFNKNNNEWSKCDDWVRGKAGFKDPIDALCHFAKVYNNAWD